MNEANWLSELFSDPVAIATLILALVTTILAGFSLWAILQNYRFRQKDRTERQLNEIAEWSEEVISVIQELIRNKAFETTPAYSQTWVYLDVLYAKKMLIIGAAKKDIKTELGQSFENALIEFDKFHSNKNRNETDQCIKSMIILLETIGEYKAKL